MNKSSADINAKYASVLEENKTYATQLETYQKQMAENMSQMQTVKDDLILKQAELDSVTSKRDEIEAQLQDLKQSVSIKLSAADDL